MRKHLEAGEAGVVSELAHALKGSSGTMGATKMRGIAQEIEKATKAGRLDPEIAALLPALEAAYAEACTALQVFISA
jgi:HPt (histidine-containing phosphotransfer) domain-containing protein